MATIAANIIFAWKGAKADIPAGWARETTLDAKYPKGTAASTNPGTTGGALTHQHTSANHLHTTAHVHTTPNDGGESGASARDVQTTNPPAVHTHINNPNTINPTTSLTNDTPAAGPDNHEPPYAEVIFIKSDGSPTGLPDKVVGLWNNSAGTPANWNLCDGGGAPARPDMRLVVAKGAATNAEVAANGGAATHGHTVASHTHSTPYAHGHPDVTSSQTLTGLTTGTISGANVSVATATHTHTLTIASASPAITGNTDTAAASNHEPPYWLLAWIQNNAAALDWPDRIIGIWLGTLANIPTNWKLCDGSNGTPDMRNLFAKGCNTLAGIGGSGGSLTHGAAHTTTGHTHPIESHLHAVTGGAGGSESRTAGAVNAATAAHTHTWGNTGAASLTSGSGSPTVNNYTDTQPPFVTVAFLQWQVPPAGPTMPIVMHHLKMMRN